MATWRKQLREGSPAEQKKKRGFFKLLTGKDAPGTMEDAESTSEERTAAATMAKDVGDDQGRFGPDEAEMGGLEGAEAAHEDVMDKEDEELNFVKVMDQVSVPVSLGRHPELAEDKPGDTVRFVGEGPLNETGDAIDVQRMAIVHGALPGKKDPQPVQTRKSRYMGYPGVVPTKAQLELETLSLKGEPKKKTPGYREPSQKGRGPQRVRYDY